VVAEVRREEILSAAQACFREQGYHRTTVDDVASRAGLSKGAIYWHFKGKREVFYALFDRYMESFEAYPQAAKGAPSAPEAFRRMAAVFREGIDEVLELVELHFEYVAHASREQELGDRYRKMYQTFRVVIEEQVRRGIRDGDFRPVDPGTVAAGIAATLDGLILQKVFVPEVDLGRLFDETVEILIRGIQT
jgi:TetR/AcrR family acrAB operon transcriptional repressor